MPQKPTNKRNTQKTHKKSQHKHTKPMLKWNKQFTSEKNHTHKKEKDPCSAETSAFCKDYLFIF